VTEMGCLIRISLLRSDKLVSEDLKTWIVSRFWKIDFAQKLRMRKRLELVKITNIYGKIKNNSSWISSL
jgi:hypothetical protein